MRNTVTTSYGSQRPDSFFFSPVRALASFLPSIPPHPTIFPVSIPFSFFGLPGLSADHPTSSPCSPFFPKHRGRRPKCVGLLFFSLPPPAPRLFFGRCFWPGFRLLALTTTDS